MTQPTPAPTGFIKNEPVIVSQFVLWVFLNVGAFVVGHTHLITNAQWSSLTSGLVPVVTAVLLGIIGAVVRKYVAPAWKVVSGDLTKWGIPQPTAAELDAIAEQIYESLLVKHAQAEAQAAQVPPVEVLAQQVPAHAGEAQ